MQSLREFFTSSSGLVPARQGLALGWVISALTGITVLLGAKETEAGACDEVSWQKKLGYSAGCDERTNGERENVCQDCWLDSNCETRCGGNYCCVA